MINKKKLFLAGAIGNSIEVFESVVYAFLQPYIAKTFFPPALRENKFLFLLTIILPFIARPIGALIFGLIGDLKGRKVVLESSMIISGISCLLISFLPSYDTIGIASFYGIIALRFLFGIAMSGEYNNSFLYLGEQAAPQSRGFILSFAAFGVNIGIFASALLAYTVSSFIETNLIPDWSFRVLFLFSVASLYIGYIARRELPETAEFFMSFPTFENNKPKAVYTTAHLQLKCMKLNMLKIIFLAGFGTHITYSLFLYGPFHLLKYNSIFNSFKDSYVFIIVSSGIVSSLIPLAGILSDKIGRKLILSVTIPALTILYLIFFIKLNPCTSEMAYWIFYSILGVFGAFYFAIAPSEIIDSLPAKMRSTTNGLLYSIPAVLFGALSLPYFQLQFDKSILSSFIILLIAVPLFLIVSMSKSSFLRPSIQYAYPLEQGKVS